MILNSVCIFVSLFSLNHQDSHPSPWAAFHAKRAAGSFGCIHQFIPCSASKMSISRFAVAFIHTQASICYYVSENPNEMHVHLLFWHRGLLNAEF